MKDITNENLNFVFGGISDDDKADIVDAAGTIGGAIGGISGAALSGRSGRGCWT